jgi:hypothetical protein
LPSQWRVATHLSPDRRETEATAFVAAFQARPAGHPPVVTSVKVPADIDALSANDSRPEPPPRRRGRGRPRKPPRRVLAPDWRDAQLDKQREGGRAVEVCRRLICGATDIITESLGDKPMTTSSVERDNLTSRQSNGR